MKKRLMSTLIAATAIAAIFALVPFAQAGQNGTDSISIKFAADEPTQAGGSMLAATDVTGVVPSANWNNVTTNVGTATGLLEDVNGVATASSAQVSWYAAGTWASNGKGEENNNFKGADHTLMSGYLDMSQNIPETTIIQVTNLPASFSGTYDVYIYAIAGFPGRGGVYTVNEAQGRGNLSQCPACNFAYFVTGGVDDPTQPQMKGGSNSFYGTASGPEFVQALGDDNSFGANNSTDDFGNYLMFTGLTGSSVVITATDQSMPALPGYNGTPRAALAAIQIVVD